VARGLALNPRRDDSAVKSPNTPGSPISGLEPAYDDGWAKVFLGDVRQVLAGLPSVGIELNPSYLPLIEKRLRQDVLPLEVS